MGSVEAFLINAAWMPLLAVLVYAVSRRYAIAVACLAAAVVVPAATMFVPTPAPWSAAAPAAAFKPAAPHAVPLTIPYLILVGIAAVRLARRCIRARRLLMRSTPWRDGIRRSGEIATPLTIGRTILLPAFLQDEALIDAAIAHERAHVRRRDYAVHLALEILTLPVAFHPAVLFLRRQVAELREMACDEEAAAQRDDYGRALVAIAALAMNRARAAALAMAETSIERRVAHLAAPRPRRNRAWAVGIVAIASLAVACRYAATLPPRPIHGVWELDAKASQFGPLPRYTGFRQAIAADGDTIAVAQTRITGNRVRHVAWSIAADGVTRPVAGIADSQGTAQWRGRRLLLDLRTPGHHERSSAFVENGRLICEGAGYRIVFRRSRG